MASGTAASLPPHALTLPAGGRWNVARSCWSPTHLIDRELLLQVEVGALAAQVLLHHLLHALLLQAVGHIIEGVLVWEGCQRLGRIRGRMLALG